MRWLKRKRRMEASMARRRCKGDQKKTDVYGKVSGAPASRPPLDVTTAMKQGRGIASDEDGLPDTELIADSRSGNEAGKSDFSFLPLLVWLKIFLYLNHRDRLALSVTCRRLYHVCRKSSILWRSVYIRIGSGNKLRYPRYLAFSTTDKSFLRAMCHKIQNAIIYVDAKKHAELHDRSHRTLFEAARQFPLKHLEVTASFETYGKYVLMDDVMEDLVDTLLTSPSASQLSCLKIKYADWLGGNSYEHLEDKFQSGLLEILKKSSFTSSLSHLYLHDVIVNVNYPGQLCKTIERFENLQILTVPVGLICASFLNSFPKQLKEVHFIIKRMPLMIPHTSVNWSRALSSHPQLTVGVILNEEDIPFDLPSVIPGVSQLKIQDFAWFFPLTTGVSELCPQIFVNLTKFDCRRRYERPKWFMDDELITFVSQCPKLDYLNFDEFVNSDTVLTLAKMRTWRVLKFDARFIVFSDSADREKELQTLCGQVSRALGRHWTLQASTDSIRPSRMGVSFQNITRYHDNHCM